MMQSGEGRNPFMVAERGGQRGQEESRVMERGTPERSSAERSATAMAADFGEAPRVRRRMEEEESSSVRSCTLPTRQEREGSAPVESRVMHWNVPLPWCDL